MKPNFILSASEDCTVRIWDLGKGKELRCLKFEFKITSMLIQEDKDICYMSGDQYVFIYSVPDMN
jgi:WD40 repeat protein